MRTLFSFVLFFLALTASSFGAGPDSLLFSSLTEQAIRNGWAELTSQEIFYRTVRYLEDYSSVSYKADGESISTDKINLNQPNKYTQISYSLAFTKAVQSGDLSEKNFYKNYLFAVRGSSGEDSQLLEFQGYQDWFAFLQQSGFIFGVLKGADPKVDSLKTADNGIRDATIMAPSEIAQNSLRFSNGDIILFIKDNMPEYSGVIMLDSNNQPHIIHYPYSGRGAVRSKETLSEFVRKKGIYEGIKIYKVKE